MFRKATTSVTLKLAKHSMTSRLLRRTFNDEHRVRQKVRTSILHKNKI